MKRVLDGRDVRVLAYDGESRFHTTATAVLGELVRLSARARATGCSTPPTREALTVAEIAAAVDAAMGVSVAS